MRLNEPSVRLAGIAFFAAYVLFVGLYIEVMNVRAGDRLPNREYRNNDPSQGPVKWRISTGKTDQDLANERLRDFVSTFGLAQYLAAPTLVILSIAMLILKKTKEQHLLAGVLPLAIGLIACALMYYRAYFSSLGW